MDESGFTNGCYVERGWLKKGENYKISSSYKRERITIFGGLTLLEQKIYWKKSKKGNSDSLIEFLRQLHKSHKDKFLFIITDNCSIHKSKKVKNFLKSNIDWIKFNYLPPYSPEYNPIERFWKWLKRKVYGLRYYETVYEVSKKIRQFLWHYSNNRLSASINFNFEPYKDLLEALKHCMQISNFRYNSLEVA